MARRGQTRTSEPATNIANAQARANDQTFRAQQAFLDRKRQGMQDLMASGRDAGQIAQAHEYRKEDRAEREGVRAAEEERYRQQRGDRLQQQEFQNQLAQDRFNADLADRGLERTPAQAQGLPNQEQALPAGAGPGVGTPGDPSQAQQVNPELEERRARIQAQGRAPIEDIGDGQGFQAPSGFQQTSSRRAQEQQRLNNETLRVKTQAQRVALERERMYAKYRQAELKNDDEARAAAKSTMLNGIKDYRKLGDSINKQSISDRPELTPDQKGSLLEIVNDLEASAADEGINFDSLRQSIEAGESTPELARMVRGVQSMRALDYIRVTGEYPQEGVAISTEFGQRYNRAAGNMRKFTEWTAQAFEDSDSYDRFVNKTTARFLSLRPEYIFGEQADVPQFGAENQAADQDFQSVSPDQAAFAAPPPSPGDVRDQSIPANQPGFQPGVDAPFTPAQIQSGQNDWSRLR